MFSFPEGSFRPSKRVPFLLIMELISLGSFLLTAAWGASSVLENYLPTDSTELLP